MPILEVNNQQIDYLDQGTGPNVLLVHSASSSNRQWRQLIETLSSRYRVIAINLFGYGETSPWPSDQPQSVLDHVGLVEALMNEVPGPIHMVGHSLGGVVALEAARLHGNRIASLSLYEPNPFHLLQHHGDKAHFDTMVEMMDDVGGLYRKGLAEQAARHFIVFWSDEASWNALPEDRRAHFAANIGASVHEGRALQRNTTPLHEYAALTIPTLLMYAQDTIPSILASQQILVQACPHWQVDVLEEGGHLAPLTHPDLVNSKIVEFLDAQHVTEG